MNQTGKESLIKEQKTAKYRTLFISDVHIGSAGCRSGDLLEFLKHNPAEQYYFVGDIIDLRLLGRGMRWNRNNNNLIRWILKRSNKVPVIFIPGNHDEEFREIVGVPFGEIAIKRDDIFVAADGKRYYITHGDEADGVVTLHPRLALVGTIAYELLIIMNIQINRLRSFLGMKHWSFSEFIKHRVKDAVKFITHFENIIVDRAKERNCYGVITGHIHTPACKMIDGVLYLNCGDWIGNRTAIAEHFDGTMELVRYQD
jgi:UDP-2,3-diacylglucosamine pyrophosphatase LpxH